MHIILALSVLALFLLALTVLTHYCYMPLHQKRVKIAPVNATTWEC